MVSKKKRLSGCRLYLILDAGVVPYPHLFDLLKVSVHHGVDIVQLRDKLGTVRDALTFSRKAMAWLKGRIPFIVNDRVDVALLSGADGVHLGQDDIPVIEARRMLGARAIIGRSCQTMGHLKSAVAEGADYAGFGSVFKTLTKPERIPMNVRLLTRAARFSGGDNFPVFMIGGIARDNAGDVLKCGARRVAVCRDILLGKDAGRSVDDWRRMLFACTVNKI